LNCQILGVSLDDESSHREFAEKHSLPFPLLADTAGIASTAYGVKTKMFGMTVAKRHTFLIDPEGRIAKHYEKVDPETHSAELLADLGALAKN
jgi:peroxiredoxin Q/BCP